MIPVPDRIGLAPPAALQWLQSDRSPTEAGQCGSLVSGNRQGRRFKPFWNWYQVTRISPWHLQPPRKANQCVETRSSGFFGNPTDSTPPGTAVAARWCYLVLQIAADAK